MEFIMSLRFAFRTALVATLTLGLMLCGIGSVNAQTLYGATGSNGIGGNLVTISTLTGSATVVGALVDGGGNPYGLTGLAFHPGNGTLYGVTNNGSPTSPGSLVSVNPATGQVTFIGGFVAFSGAFGDIAFDATGVLYGTRAVGSDLYTINLVTGAASLVGGASGVSTGSSGHGLSMNSSGTLFTVPDGNNLYTFNTGNGAATIGAALSGAPFLPARMNAMSFNAADTLFAVNTNAGAPALTHLVTINTGTGAVTDIGASIDDLDALEHVIKKGTQVRLEAGRAWRRSELSYPAS